MQTEIHRDERVPEGRLWLRAEVRKTSRLRPNYLQEQTFATERLLFRVFISCTPRCGRPAKGRGSSLADPLRTS
jgi:hypothetical protein